jgi:hypothetical protein
VSDTISNEIKVDKTALSYWFPKLVEAGIPVPKTKIVQMPANAQRVIWNWFDGKAGDAADQPSFNTFITELRAAALGIGFPIFLRTDHTSAKHSWRDTCFVKSLAELEQHVYEIAEFSEIADMIGLPWDTWVVREFLPTMPFGDCPRYGDMPVCREAARCVERQHQR